RVAGAQVKGFIGVSEEYILSPRFLASEGGLSRLVWMNSSLKSRLKLNAEYIATEKECINLAGLKEFLVAWRH
ncbi:acetyl-CoA decarbonylase/synthase complex subunit beta 1, partial [bacterium]|nr:acetyl-CoA decarbonylase/synthase complex subunit beta 1 [bacterium]